jgi:predicted DNA-binding transcriptional regulator AlpA
MEGQEREYLSVADVGKLCGVSKYTVANWRREGTGPPCLKIGGTWRYEKSAVYQWIDKINT